MASITKAAFALSLLLFLTGCTDGATRIAYDIKSEADKLQRSDEPTYVIRHVPEEHPEGCGDAYKVQFSKDSLIVIWCKDSKTGETTSSHSTTYHLNFVKVPESYILEKKRSEPVLIELSKENGAIVVTNVR